MRWLVLIFLVACAHSRVQPGDGPDRPPPSQERHYTVWFGGGRVGTAIEREVWGASGVTLHREETMRFYRGDAVVTLVTTVEIAASHALVPSRVAWSERSGAGTTLREASATREGSAWRVRGVDGAMLASDAIPAELVPLIVRRDGAFAGHVFLPARGFLGGTGRIDPVAPDRLVAQLEFAGGALAEATIDLQPDRNFARVVDGEGVIALRVTAEQAAAPFQPLDLIAATAIPIGGTPSHTLILDGSIALPPVPGQLARPAREGMALELSPRLPGDLPLAVQGRDRSREIATLVAQVRARIAPDLSVRGSPSDAGSATAGDCTTFALAYAALAAQRSIPTRVVTGLRIDDNRLVRHRWTVSWTGRAWIAVDAAYGHAPAGGDLVGLAVHGADDAGLVAGEAALTQVRSATWK